MSIGEGKIVIFRITSGVILTPDITFPYVGKHQMHSFLLFTPITMTGWQNKNIDYLPAHTYITGMVVTWWHGPLQDMGAVTNFHLSK